MGLPGAARGRLSWRPHAAPVVRAPSPGTHVLDVADGSHAVVRVPAGRGPVRLVVLLHGAGGRPDQALALLADRAEQHRLLLAAPASRGVTWDVVTGRPGPDVEAVDDLLDRLSAAHDVRGCTIAGFSDGASCALSLGIANGDVVDSVVAFSPGFAARAVRHGAPRVFVSHGDDDQVLPVDRCSRRLVPALLGEGYDVTYDEFAGGHEVPADVRERAVDWLVGGPSHPR